MSNTHPKQKAKTEEGAPLAPLLTAVASELERARQLGWRVERASCSLAMLPGAELETLRELQQLDAMLQQLAALRDFLIGLSGESGRISQAAVDAALARITLHDVKQRLAGAEDGVGESDGAVDLF